MIRFFAAHPTAANLTMIAIYVLGLFALPSLQRETFPDVTVDVVNVTVRYPGASPSTIEESIVQRIEDAVDGVAGVVEVRSIARESLAQVSIEMKRGGDLTAFYSEIASEVGGISDFPVDAEDAIISSVGHTAGVVSVAVTGPMSTTDLKAYCEQLKRTLKRYPKVSLVEIDGFSDRQLQIRLRTAAASQFGLSIADVADAIAAQSVDLPLGSIEATDGEISVRMKEERRSISELADTIIIGGRSGAEIRLGDIADITDSFEDEEDKIYFNGKRACLLQVSKTKKEDALDTMADVTDFVDRTNKIKPPGVELSLTNDQATKVRERLELVLVNAGQGLVLVFFTLWLFFNFRLAFWVAAGLPVSVLGAIFIMMLAGYSLNMMSLLAMLMSLGLLMDDAIVLAENVASHQARGKSALQAAIDGVDEVKWGVLSSYATTIGIFVPLAFLQGRIGQVLLVVPIVLVAVLSVSLIEGFLILPLHLSHIKPTQNNRFRLWFDRMFRIVREQGVGTTVDFAVKHRYFTVGGTVGVLILSIGLVAGGVVKFQAFPEVDGDTIQLRLTLPEGTPLSQTEATIADAVAALEEVNLALTPKQPGGETLVKSVTVLFNQNQDVGGVGPHLATISVDILDAGVRTLTSAEVCTKWRDAMGPISDAVSANFTAGKARLAGDAISVRLQGENMNELNEVAGKIKVWFDQYKGTADLRSDMRPGKPEIEIHMRPGAVSTSLRAASIAKQVRAALFGEIPRRVQVGAESFEIHVKADKTDSDSAYDLKFFPLSIPGGKEVPLGAVANLEMAQGYSQIARVNGVRTVTVVGAVDTDIANVSELTNLFNRDMRPKLSKMYPGVRVSHQGEAKESGKTAGSMLRGFAIGLMGIFILLSLQFRNYTEPLAVMVAIPFALIGVITGFLLMHEPISLPGILGFCALSGVVVNDSILLVQFIKLRLLEGDSVVVAASQASRSRFRAVLLTSATTAAGLMPLMFETSRQAQTLIPVAIAIVFGTLSATTLVLIVLPSIYGILGDLGLVSGVVDVDVVVDESDEEQLSG